MDYIMKNALLFLSILVSLFFSHFIYAGCVGNCENGYGTYTWESGDQYQGYWVNGKKNGYGKKTWTTGDKYEGNYVGGKKHGYGTYTFGNGNKYEGKWENGKKIGSEIVQSNF